MPAHALAELEDIGPIVGLRPRFRQVGLEGLGSRRHRGARLDLDEAAVRKREVRRDAVVIRDEVWIESSGRVFAADAEHTAALRRFRRQRSRSSDRMCRNGGTTQLEEVTSGERHRGASPFNSVDGRYPLSVVASNGGWPGAAATLPNGPK